MDVLASVLAGSVSTLALVVALFFVRFWMRTRDAFFLLFAAAFAIDGVSRLVLTLARYSDESEAYYYLPRLVMFGLIIAAVLLKNRPAR
ncbi:MAG TPA: DUF5985 family protein [Reyranella sp.]|jgi:uncharacterized membrane protein HdeD (DUF308 family)|nr:DUF5985 family protein [Reyranella sp.]